MPSHIAFARPSIETSNASRSAPAHCSPSSPSSVGMFFGGTMLLTMNLSTGMTGMESAWAPDLMVVPQNTVQKAEALLTNGNPSTSDF